MLNPSATLPIFVISPCKSANLDANSGTAFVPSAMSFSSSFGLEIILATSSAGRPVSFVSSAVASERTLDTVSGWSERASRKCSRGPIKAFVFSSSGPIPERLSAIVKACRSIPSTASFALATRAYCLSYFVRLRGVSNILLARASAVSLLFFTFFPKSETVLSLCSNIFSRAPVFLPSACRVLINSETVFRLFIAASSAASFLCTSKAALSAFFIASLTGFHILLTLASSSSATPSFDAASLRRSPMAASFSSPLTKDELMRSIFALSSSRVFAGFFVSFSATSGATPRFVTKSCLNGAVT